MDNEGEEYDEPFYSLLENKIIVKGIPNKTHKGHKTWEDNQSLLAPLTQQQLSSWTTPKKLYEESKKQKGNDVEKMSKAIGNLWGVRVKNGPNIKKILCPLLVLPPQALGGLRNADGEWSLDISEKTIAWAAGLLSFGRLFGPDIIYRPNTPGKNLTIGMAQWELEIQQALPYETEKEMLDECHDGLRTLAIGKVTRSPKDWRAEAEEAGRSQGFVLRKESARLAKTPPTKVMGWTEEGLTLSNLGAYWVAINNTWGSRWIKELPPGKKLDTSDTPPGIKNDKFFQDTPREKPKAAPNNDNPKPPHEITPVKPTKKTSFLKQVDQSFPFLKRPSAPLDQKRTKKASYNYRTYLRMSIPIVVESKDEYGKTLANLVSTANLILKEIIGRGNGTALLPFSGKSNKFTPDITTEEKIPNTKRGFNNLYSDEIILRWAPNHSTTEIRILLGHKVRLDEAIAPATNLANEQGISLYKDPIQAEKRVVVGVLLGIVPKGRQLIDDLRTTILKKKGFQSPGMSSVELVIKLFQTEKRMNKNDPRVPVITVMCSDTNQESIFAKFKAMYPSKPKPRGSYPLGIQYRFTKDVNRLITPKDARIAKLLRAKMKNFQTTTDTHTYYGIKDIYKPVPNMEMTNLAKVLSAMKSSQFEGKSLFYAIEQEYIEGPAIFHYDRAVEQEVRSIIMTIPKFIEGHFGKTTATELFTKDAWAMLENYSVTKTPTGIQISANDENDWEDFNDDDEFGIDTYDEDNEGIIFISNFSLLSLETERTHILTDDGKSTRSIETLKPSGDPGDLEPDKMDLERGSQADTSSLSESLPSTLKELEKEGVSTEDVLEAIKYIKQNRAIGET